MTRPDRLRRVDEAVRKVLSEGIAELKDPRIGFVTVTAVEVTKDLEHATVWVSVLASEKARERTFGRSRARPACCRAASTASFTCGEHRTCGSHTMPRSSKACRCRS